VWVVDAVSSGAAAGTLHRFDAGARALPAALFRASTHHIGLPEAVELARAVDGLPEQLVVFGVEAGDVGVGGSLTPAVAAAVERTAVAVQEEVLACAESRRTGRKSC
jgi:hydrogenase maturation protease